MRWMVRYAVVTGAGLVLGIAVGLGLGHRSFDRGIEVSSDVLALGEYETLASLQYKESDIPHAKQAIVGLLKFMDEMEANNKHGIQREMDLDRAIACMRLALLAEKEGNISDSKNYIAKAQESLRKRGGQDMPEDRLRELVRKFDDTATYKLPGVFLLSRGASK